MPNISIYFNNDPHQKSEALKYYNKKLRTRGIVKEWKSDEVRICFHFKI